MIANEGIAVVVNHDGVIQIAPPIIQDFDTDAYLSSCLRIGDVSARVSHLFSQQSWTNTWSDERLGASITAQFNHTIYPIVVTNDGAVTERWRLLFTNATTVDIIAEDLGAIATGLTIVEDIAPINPITNKPFFTIPHLGWGAKWVTGNILRFNTAGADYPIDILRCVSHGPAGVDADRIGLEFLGDIDA
jgi:hypothetical protein